MKITFVFPFRCFISGPSEKSLNLKASFEESGYAVELTFIPEISEALQLETAPKESKYFKQTNGLRFTLISLPECNRQFNIDSLELDPKMRKELLILFVEIVNKTLETIRNFGTIPYLQKIYPDFSDSEVDRHLRVWDVELSGNDKKHSFKEKSDAILGSLSFLFKSDSEAIPELNTYHWAEIGEALQDKLINVPEKEFFVNALEFLRKKNFRMALLESIICLEIVFNRYVRSFLKIRKEISEKRIKIFLLPQLGLSARIAGIIDWILDKDDIKDIDIENVLDAISCRNKLVHTTGYLPSNLTEEEARKYITNVLILSQILARKKDLIDMEPDLQIIAKDISENNNVPLPFIRFFGRHIFFIDINFLFQKLPEKGILERVAIQLGEKLKEKDRRFIPDKHLLVTFKSFPDKINARWSVGSFKFIEESGDNAGKE